MLCCLLWWLGQASWACHIQIYPYLYFLNSPQELNLAIFPQQTCPASMAHKLLALIQQQNGAIKTKYLLAALKSSFSSQDNEGPSNALSITPDQIEIHPLATYLATQYNLKANIVISNLRLLDQRTWLGSFQTLHIDSPALDKNGVLSLGENNLKLTYFPAPANSSPPQTLWLSAKLQERQKVLVAQVNIAPGQRLNAAMFNLQEMPVDHLGHYFTTLENLNYFKTNKALAKNTILKQQDLTAEPLVRPSLPVTAIIEQGRLKMKNTAIPRSIGHWGDTISLEVGAQKKIVAGKVIGPNRVLIQL